jgi:hypothetical protein
MTARILNIGIGLWLMVLPFVLDLPRSWANHEYIIAPIIISIAIISTSESTRDFRYANTLLGVWLLLSPWLLQHLGMTYMLNETIAGLLVITFSLIRGKVSDRFGGGWRSLLAKTPAHLLAVQEKDKNKNQRYGS